MIDIYAPMELDDGRPVEMVPEEDWGEEDEDYKASHVLIRVNGAYERHGDPDDYGEWWYDRETGCWDGLNAEVAYVLRNVAADEPVVEEDWS